MYANFLLCSLLVFPAEIEELLMQHSNIIDAAVIGVNSDEGTDLPMFVFVILLLYPQFYPLY